jgi:NADPH:quinone reductase-like Zn-dependent oxidoreductase
MSDIFIVGFAFSGVIDQVGECITRFKTGDEVYGMTGFSLGAYAEYRCMPETDSRNHGCLALKPHNITREEAAAAAYGGLLALQYCDKGNINAGDEVLIYGASGSAARARPRARVPRSLHPPHGHLRPGHRGVRRTPGDVSVP